MVLKSIPGTLTSFGEEMPVSDEHSLFVFENFHGRRNRENGLPQDG
jgi:hypothetical protein